MPLVRDRPRGIARSRSPHAFAGPWALTSGMTAEAGHEIAVPDAYRRRCSPLAPTQERQRCQGRLRRLGWTRTNNLIAVRRLLVEPDDPEVLPRCTANEPRCRCPGCRSARPVSDKPGHARPVPPGSGIAPVADGRAHQTTCRIARVRGRARLAGPCHPAHRQRPAYAELGDSARLAGTSPTLPSTAVRERHRAGRNDQSDRSGLPPSPVRIAAA